MPKIKHQLFIHLDYGPAPDGLEIRYSYPFSVPHPLREQLLKIPRDRIPEDIKKELNFLIDALSSRIPEPIAVRLPHAKIKPSIQKAVTTIVIQDQRPSRTPLARMYYWEVINTIKSGIEHQVRMEPGDFSISELKSWERLQKYIKRIAWEHYKSLIGKDNLLPE